MKIYFCDECNESIPLQDIKDNKAVTLKGKIYCNNCNPLQGIKERPVSQPGGGMFTYLFFVVIVLLGVVIYLMISANFKNEEVKYVTTQAFDLSQEEIAGLGGAIEELKGEVRELGKKLDVSVTGLSNLESEVLVIRGDLQGLGAETDNMTKNFQSVTNARERLDKFALKQDEFTATLRAFEKGFGAFAKQLSALELKFGKLKNLIDSGTSLVAEGGFGAGGSFSEPPKESAALLKIKDKLTSDDDGERFEAVYQVLDERIKEALPLVLPLIEDPDQFVQVGAIQTVGEFLYSDAVPHLIKVLRDPDVTVRDEALRQLVRMTGQNDLDFDVRGPVSQREKAIRKWEKWVAEGGK